ncbi:unnamed protein product [Chrysoparadoxa australica]
MGTPNTLNLEDEFSFQAKFRASGATDECGESLSFWVTNAASWLQEGSTYGFGDDFLGVGVAITSMASHSKRGCMQKVTLVSNNGKGLEEREGCTIRLRYHEGREDFTPMQASQLRVAYKDGTLRVDVDAKNRGAWQRCAEVTDFARIDHSRWLSDARVGIVAKTGEHQDHHDLMDFHLYSEFGEAEAATHDMSVSESKGRDEKLTAAAHFMEHELYGVFSSIKSLASSLERKEEMLADRLDKLESKMTATAFSELDQRLIAMEERLRSEDVSKEFDRRLNHAARRHRYRMVTFFRQETVSGRACSLFPFPYPKQLPLCRRIAMPGASPLQSWPWSCCWCSLT